MKGGLDFSTECFVSGVDYFSGNGKLRRSLWVSGNMVDDDILFFQDGEISKLMFSEIIETYVSGQFIASIVLGFSFIERSIAGRLAFVGKAQKRDKNESQNLLDAALREGWLLDAEVEFLNGLREIRNPIVHFRDSSKESRPESRARLKGMKLQESIELDAGKMLEAVVRVLKKTAL